MSKGGDSSSSATVQTPAQWAAALSNTTIAAWKEADILALSLDKLQALTTSQIGFIKVPWALPGAAWTADTLNAVPLQYWSQFGTRYVSTTNNGITSVAPLSQLSGVSTGSASNNINWFDDLGYSYSGSRFTFSPNVIAGISVDRIAAIGGGLGNARHAPNLTVNNGTVEAQAFESAIAVATSNNQKMVSWNISGTQKAYMFGAGWADMGSSFMSSLSSAQLGAISNPETKLGNAQLGYLTANQLIALTMDWSLVTAAQLNAITPQAFSGLQTNNIAAISEAAWGGLDQAHTVTLNAVDIGLLSAAKVARLEYLGYALTASVGAVLTALQVQSIQSKCWAQISDTGFLNSLSISAFQAIPASAFASMNTAILVAVDALHLSSLTPSQLRTFPLSGVSDASAIAALFYVNPSTLNFSDFVNNPNVNWALAPASFIKQLSLDQLKMLHPTQFAKLSLTAINGLTRSQTQALMLEQIQAMSTAQLGAAVYISRRTDVVQQIFTPATVTQMVKSFWQHVDSSFLNALSVNSFQAITTSQIEVISTDAFAGLDQVHFNSFTGTQLLALTAPQVGVFSGTYLTIPFLRGVRLNAFKGLVPDQLHRLHDYLFNTVAANAFATADPELLKTAENQFASLLATIMDTDDGRQAWLRQSVKLLIQLQWLDDTAASTLSASDVQNIYSALNWSWMNGSFLNNIMTSVFAQIKPESIAQLNVKAIAVLNEAHVQAFTVTQAAALSGEQLSSISNLGVLQVSVVQSLSAEQIAGITQDWSTINTVFLENMLPTQFAAMTPVQFGQLSYAQIANPNNHINWALLSADDWNALSVATFALLCQGSDPPILQASTEALLQLGGAQLVALANASKSYNSTQVRTLLNALFGYFNAEQSQQVLNLVLNDSVDQIVLKVALINTLADIDGTVLGTDMAIQTLVTMQETQPSWFDGGSLALLVPVLMLQYKAFPQAIANNVDFTTYFHNIFATSSFLPSFISFHSSLSTAALQDAVNAQVAYKALFSNGSFDEVLINQIRYSNSTEQFLANGLPNLLNLFWQRMRTGEIPDVGVSRSFRQLLVDNFDSIRNAVIADVNADMRPGGEALPLITVEDVVNQKAPAKLLSYLKTRFNSSVDNWLQGKVTNNFTSKAVNVAAAQAARTALALGGLLASLPGFINELGRAVYISDKLPTKEKNALLVSASLGAITYVSQALVIPGAMVVEAIIQKYTGVKYQNLSYTKAIWEKFTEGFVTLYKNEHDRQINTRAQARQLVATNENIELHFVTQVQNVRDAQGNVVGTVNVIDALSPDPVFVKITDQGAATVLASNRQGVSQTSFATFDDNGRLVSLKDVSDNTMVTDPRTVQMLERLAATANSDQALVARTSPGVVPARVKLMMIVQEDLANQSVRLNKALGVAAGDNVAGNVRLYTQLVENNIERFVYRAWQLGIWDSQVPAAQDILTTTVNRARALVQSKGVTLTSDINTQIVSAVSNILNSKSPSYESRDYFLTLLQRGHLSALDSPVTQRTRLIADGYKIPGLEALNSLRDQVATDYALQVVAQKVNAGGYDVLIQGISDGLGTVRAGQIAQDLTNRVQADLLKYGIQFSALDSASDYTLSFQTTLKLRILNQLRPPAARNPMTGEVGPDADLVFYRVARMLGIENQPEVIDRVAQYALHSLAVADGNDGVPRSDDPVIKLVEHGEEIFGRLTNPIQSRNVFDDLGVVVKDQVLGKALANIVAENAFRNHIINDPLLLVGVETPTPVTPQEKQAYFETTISTAIRSITSASRDLIVNRDVNGQGTARLRAQLADLVTQGAVFQRLDPATEQPLPGALNKVPEVTETMLYEAVLTQLKILLPQAYADATIDTIRQHVLPADVAGIHQGTAAFEPGAIYAMEHLLSDHTVQLRIPEAGSLRVLVPNPAGGVGATKPGDYTPLVSKTIQGMFKGGLREILVKNVTFRQAFNDLDNASVDDIKGRWDGLALGVEQTLTDAFANWHQHATELAPTFADSSVRDYFALAGQGSIDIRDITNTYLSTQKEIFLTRKVQQIGAEAQQQVPGAELAKAVQFVQNLGEDPTSPVYAKILDNAFARVEPIRQHLVPQPPVDLLVEDPRLAHAVVEAVDVLNGAGVAEVNVVPPDLGLPVLKAHPGQPELWVDEVLKPIFDDIKVAIIDRLQNGVYDNDAARYRVIVDATAEVLEDARGVYRVAIKTLTDAVLQDRYLGTDYFVAAGQALDTQRVELALSKIIGSAVKAAPNGGGDVQFSQRFDVRNDPEIIKNLADGARDVVHKGLAESGLDLEEGNARLLLRVRLDDLATLQQRQALRTLEVVALPEPAPAQPIAVPESQLVSELKLVRQLGAVIRAPKLPGVFDADASLDLAQAVVDYAVKATPRGGNYYQTIAEALNAEVLPVSLRNNLLRVINKYGITTDASGNFNLGLVVTAEDLQNAFLHNYHLTPDADDLHAISGETVQGLAAKIPATLKLRIALPQTHNDAFKADLGGALLKLFVAYTAENVLISSGVEVFMRGLKAQLIEPDRRLLDRISAFAADEGLTRDINGQLSRDILITGDMVRDAVVEQFIRNAGVQGDEVRIVLDRLAAQPEQRLSFDQLGGQMELITLDPNRVRLAVTEPVPVATPALNEVVVVQAATEDVYNAEISKGVAGLIAKDAISAAIRSAVSRSGRVTVSHARFSFLKGWLGTVLEGFKEGALEDGLRRSLQEYLSAEQVMANREGRPMGLRVSPELLVDALVTEIKARIVPAVQETLVPNENGVVRSSESERQAAETNQNILSNIDRVKPELVLQMLEGAVAEVNRYSKTSLSMETLSAAISGVIGVRVELLPAAGSGSSASLQAQASKLLVDILLISGTDVADIHAVRQAWDSANQRYQEVVTTKQLKEVALNAGKLELARLQAEADVVTAKVNALSELVLRNNNQLQAIEAALDAVRKNTKITAQVRQLLEEGYLQTITDLTVNNRDVVKERDKILSEGYDLVERDENGRAIHTTRFPSVQAAEQAVATQRVSLQRLQGEYAEASTQLLANKLTLDGVEARYSQLLKPVVEGFFQDLQTLIRPTYTTDGAAHYTVPERLKVVLREFGTTNELVVNGGKLTNLNLEDFSLALNSNKLLSSFVDGLKEKQLLSPAQIDQLATGGVQDRLAVLFGVDAESDIVRWAQTNLEAVPRNFPAIMTEEVGLPRVSLTKSLATTNAAAADNPFTAATLATQKTYAKLVSTEQARVANQLTAEIVHAVSEGTGRTANAQELFDEVRVTLEKVSTGREEAYGAKQIVENFKARWGLEIDPQGNSTIRINGERVPLASILSGEGLTNAILKEIGGVAVEYQTPEKIYQILTAQRPGTPPAENPLLNPELVQSIAVRSYVEAAIATAMLPAESPTPVATPEPDQPVAPPVAADLDVPIVRPLEPLVIVAEPPVPLALDVIVRPNTPEAPALAPDPATLPPEPPRLAPVLQERVPAFNQEAAINAIEASTVNVENAGLREAVREDVDAGVVPRGQAVEADAPAREIVERGFGDTLAGKLEVLNSGGISAGLLAFGIFSAVVGIAAGIAGLIYASLASGISWQARAMVYAMNVVRILSSTVIIAASAFQILSVTLKTVEVAASAAKLSTITFGVGNVIGIATNITQIGTQAATLETATDSSSKLIAGLAILDAVIQLIVNVVGLIALALGPIGVVINLVLLVVSLLIPSAAAIATAVKYRESWENLKSKGLYHEAEVMYVYYETAILDATPIINWTSAFYTSGMKSAQQRSMDYAWMDASAQERMIYSMKNNVDLTNSFDNMRRQINAAAVAISQPVVNLSNVMTRAVVLMTSQDNLSYFEGDKVASVKLAGVYTYNTNTLSRAPKLISAIVQDDTLVLTFNQSLASLLSQLPSMSQFVVMVNGTATTVRGLSLSDSTITLTLATAVTAAQSVTVSYTDPTVGNDDQAVQNQMGKDAVSFSNYAVVNTTRNADGTRVADTRAPLLRDAVVLDSYLSLTFDESLDGGYSVIPDISAFSVLVNNTVATIFDVRVSGNRVLLSLLEPVATGATVTVSYTPSGTRSLRDFAGNSVPSFSGANAVNVDNVTATATIDAVRIGWLEYHDFVATTAGTGKESSAVLNGSDYTVYDNSNAATNGTSRLRYLSLSNVVGEYDVYSVVRSAGNNDHLWIDASNALGAVSFSVNTNDLTVWGGQGKNSYSLAREYANSAYIVAANSWGKDTNVVSIAGNSTDSNKIVNLDYLLTLDNISAGLPVTQNVFKVQGSSDGMDVVVGTANNQNYYATTNVANVTLTGANANVFVGESSTVKVGLNARVLVDMDMKRELSLVNAGTDTDVSNSKITGGYGSYSLLNFAPTDSVDSNFIGRLNMVYSIGHIPKKTAFSVLAGGNAIAVSNMSISGNKVILQLASAVQQNQVVRVGYADANMADDKNTLQDLMGNDAASFTPTNVVNITADVNTPIVKIATVQGSTLVIRFSETLAQQFKPLNSAFTVKVNNTQVSVTKVSFYDTTSVRLTLNSAVVSGQMVSVSYTDSSATDSSLTLQDLAGNTAASFNTSVLNLADIAQGTAPHLLVEGGATINGALLTLTFDATPRYTFNDASAFSVYVDNSSVTINSVSVFGNSVLLRLASTVTATQVVGVNYTQPHPQSSNDSNTLKDWLGNQVNSLSLASVRNITGLDLTPPSLSYAIIDGNTMKLTFSEILNSSNGFTVLPNAFVVSSAEQPVSITQVTTSENTVTLTLARAVSYGELVTVSYTDSISTNIPTVVQDLAGNHVASFTGVKVVNKTPDITPPVIINAVVIGNQLQLTFSETLESSTGRVPLLSSMYVQASGRAVGIDSGSIHGETVLLTLNYYVQVDDYVTFNYIDPIGTNNTQKFQDLSGNYLASIVNYNATNLTGRDLVAPSLVSSSVNGNILTLTFSDALASTTDFTPGVSAFKVSVDGTVVSVASVTLNGTQAILLLSEVVRAQQKVTVGYTQPNNHFIQDGSGNATSSFVPVNVTNSTPDTIAPTISSATIAGAILSLTFSESLLTEPSYLPMAKQFAVHVDGQVVDVVSAVTSGKVVTITLSHAVSANQVVSVDYTANIEPIDHNVQDATYNVTASFSKQVSNWSGIPSIQNATVNGTQLTLTFNQELDSASGHVPSLSAFAVQSSTGVLSVSALQVSGHTVTLTLSQAVTYGQTLTVNYTDPSISNDSQALQNFIGQDVQTFTAPYWIQNLTPKATDNTPPSLSTAVVNGSTLTMTFSETLDAGLGEWAVDYLPNGQQDANGNPLVTAHLMASGFVNVLGSDGNDNIIINDQSGLDISKQVSYIQLGNGKGVKVTNYDTSGNLLLALGNKGQADVTLGSGSVLQKLFTTKLVNSNADVTSYKFNRDTVTLNSYSSLTAYLGGYEVIDATEQTSNLTAEIGDGDHIIKLGGQTVNLQFDRVASNTTVTTHQIPRGWMDYQYFNFKDINADGLWIGQEQDGTVLFKAQWLNNTTNVTDNLTVAYDGTTSNLTIGVGHVLASENSSQLRLDKLIEVMANPAFSHYGQANSNAMSMTDTSSDSAQVKLYRVTDIVSYSAQSTSVTSTAV